MIKKSEGYVERQKILAKVVVRKLSMLAFSWSSRIVLLICLTIYTIALVGMSKVYPTRSRFGQVTALQEHGLYVAESSWYGVAAYPIISGQNESWHWISTFIESIPQQSLDNCLKTYPQLPSTSPITVNSIRFDGTKTISSEEVYLTELFNSNKFSMRATVIPAYDCFHRDCFEEKKKLVLREPTSFQVTDEIVIIHAQITDIYELDRITASLTSQTQVLITAITVFPLQAKQREWEDNLDTPLYDYFQRLYFDYNWIPLTSIKSDCSTYEKRSKDGCLLWITWKAWNPSEPLQYFPPAGDGSPAMELQRLSSFLNHPRSYACKVSQKIGGSWSANSFVDGQYTLCLDSLRPALAETNSCLIYSFGVNDDWLFDDAMHELGCEVHSFDPSINKKSHKRNTKHWFHNWGLASNTSTVNPRWPMFNYTHVLKKLGHQTRTMNVLKVDVEGAEWSFLRDAIYDATFDMVDQFVLEIHCADADSLGSDLIRQRSLYLHNLEKKGFVLFSSRVKNYGLDLRSLDFSRKLKSRGFLYELSFVKLRWQ